MFSIAFITKIAVLLSAISIHNYSVGKAAHSLGDPTIKNSRRFTLNPFKHIDPFGAIAFFITGFGWAKPIPVDVKSFQNQNKDTILMVLSGSISNFSAALIAGLFFRFFSLDIPIFKLLLILVIHMNICFGLFNLLPIPPLTGSHIISNILSSNWELRYYQISRFAPYIVFVILISDHFLFKGQLNKILLLPVMFFARLFAGNEFIDIMNQLGSSPM